MVTVDMPLLALSVAAPALAASLAGRETSPSAARRIAIGGAGVTLAILAAVAAMHATRSPDAIVAGPLWLGAAAGSRPLFAVDALSAPMALLVAALGLLLTVGARRVDVEPEALRGLLLTESALLGLVCSRDLLVLTAFWALSGWPTWRALARGPTGEERRASRSLRRTFVVAQAIATAPLVVVAGWLLATAPSRLDLARLGLDGLPPGGDTLLLMGFGVAILARMAVLPLQGWLPHAFGRGPLAMVALLAAAQPGAYLLARVAGPLALHRAHGLEVGLGDLGLATALVAALITLAQRDLRRLIGWLSVSQSGLIVLGLSEGHSAGGAGALVLVVASGLAIALLAVLAGAVEDRAGTTAIASLGGVAIGAPALSSGFLVAGLAAVGFPGFLGFVAEDLLLRGSIEQGLLPTVAVVVAMAINGISVVRAWVGAFLGPAPRGRRPLPDLVGRERWALAAAVIALAVVGGLPSIAVRHLSSGVDAATAPAE